MKMARVLISLLIICLLFTSFGGQVVKAGVNPSLYYTQQELDSLKALKTSPSHSAMWNNISSWAADHLSDTPPSEPSGFLLRWNCHEQCPSRPLEPQPLGRW